MSQPASLARPTPRPAVRSTAPRRNLFRDRASGYWYTRVRVPGRALPVKRACGTTDEALAKKIVRMADALHEQPVHWPILQAVADGRVELRTVYARHLRLELPALVAELADVDVAPSVDTWLAQLRASGDVTPRTVDDYARQLAHFFPRAADGGREPAMRSTLTEAWVTDRLGALDVTTGTKRRYFDALRAFCGWATRRVPLTVNPCAHVAPPKNGDPRTTYFEHADVLRVIAALEAGDAFDATVAALVTLMFGTGMELSAALAATGRDVQRGHRAVYAHGTKNGFRDRPCFVTGWAWPAVVAWADRRAAASGATARLFAGVNEDQARRRFYAAQARAGLAAPRTAGERWTGHTFHDCRHSFCVNRILGLDGEPPRDLQYCADQLGHADTVMVSRIYGKLRLRERLAAQRDYDKEHGR